MVFESEVLSSAPVGWKVVGRTKSVDADPMNGKPSKDWVSAEVKEARIKEGNCRECGTPLPVKSGRGRKPTMCKECAAKGNRTRLQVQRAKLNSTRRKVGSVPERVNAFANHVIWWNRGVRNDERLTWMDRDFSEVGSMARPVMGSFTSEWNELGADPMDWDSSWSKLATGPESEWSNDGFKGWVNEAAANQLRMPVINRKEASQGVRLGSDCREFISESEAMPSGVEPERVGPQVCDECGEGLTILPARGRDVQAKVGAKVLACPKCGLVHGTHGIVSHAPKSNQDWSGAV